MYPNLILYMKKFEFVILSTVITTLIVSFAQVAVAIPNDNIVIPDFDLKYELYLQTVVRDANGQLLSVSESGIGWIVISSFPDGVQIPGFIDYLMDNDVLAEKEIISIGNVKYEKIQFQTETIVDNVTLTNLGAAKVGMFSGTMWKFCGDFKKEYGYQCVPLLEARTPQIHIDEGDVVTNQWTVLRIMN